ncbi:sugar ABC transporter substrate-binding protein [Phytohabitans sp. ZYX-F-186]|uniref:Sugar ABC transporter substrate-binding protein n=2 Tax=Phytohabitans maris TaxID=3071409 RepID=A0ABU0ZHR5_9ACTN|nr:sugar ABC transporter substrate-binding protein [Phytohabitans sp. ZYX-F-186]
MNRRHLLRLGAFAAIGVTTGGALTACGDGDSGGDGVAELSMWTFLDPAGTDPRGKALKEIVDGFNASQSAAKVTVTSMNYAKIDGEVIRAANTGGGPDIVNIYTPQLAQHVEGGSIQEIDEYANDWLSEAGADYLFPIDSAKVDGKLMALPWESRVWLLWYRKDILDKYKVSAPTTLDEAIAAGAAIRKASGNKITGFAIGLSEQSLGADFMEKFDPFTAGFGGEIIGADGKAAFASAAGEQAMALIKKAADAGAMGREVLTMGADEVVNGVKAGTVAMAIEGSYRVASARSAEGVGDNLVTLPVPSTTAGKNMPTAVAGQTLAMGANTDHPEQVWAFMRYYLSAESQAKFAAAGVLPVLKSVYDSDAIAKAANATELLQWRDYLATDGKVSRFPADYSELSTNLVKAAQNMIFNGAAVPAALSEVQTQYNQKGK